jgi:hypothetical protein
MVWKVEYTDTFGGEANYSWVRRETVNFPLRTLGQQTPDGRRREMGRGFKKALGLTNVRGRTYWHGDAWEFWPYRSATVAFARWVDE